MLEFVYVDGPTGSAKALSHIEGASPRVTSLNLDQWTSTVGLKRVVKFRFGYPVWLTGTVYPLYYD